MTTFNSLTEIYYCKQTETPGVEHRLVPAPSVTISPEVYYANDSVIGYTYNFTLNGYANSLRKELNADSVDYGADKTVQHIGDIRTIFNTNGGNLYIKQNDNNIIVAKGATIKNITFNTSSNRWVNYAPFSVELEFNEVDFIGCSNNPTIACNSSFFNASSLSSNLVDINTYKIKQFNDSWSFTIDNEIYQSYNDIQNNIFKVTYNLSATGKHYYVNDTLVPAWQQAKNFVQDRLYKQVNALINGVLQIGSNNQDGCAGTKTIQTLYDVDNSAPRSNGLFTGGNTLKDGSSANYDVYNETISCSTSEAEGTFSITYNAILKKNHPALNPQENAAIHTFTKNVSNSFDAGKTTTTISVQGSIKGLVRGGFIYYSNEYKLPQNGSFVTLVDSAETKYGNALAYYKAVVGTDTDLRPQFKGSLNITKKELLVSDSECPGEDDPDEDVPTSSFSLDHNYHEGTIGYSSSYDSQTAKNKKRGYTNISIVRTDPVEIIQEFVVPGRKDGPIIQKLGMKTSRTVSINIDGASEENKECITFCEDGGFKVCEDTLPKFNIKDFDKLVAENDGWIKTREDYTSNKLDGSFSISLEYTCKG